MTKAPISLQELRRRIYRKAKSDKTHRFWGLFVHIAKIETLRRHTVWRKGTAGRRGSRARSLRTSKPRGGQRFWRKCGRSSSQAGTNPSRTARWKFRKEMAKSERFRFLASATAWCKAR